MKLKVKDMDIATGGSLVVIMNQEDASKLDLHHEDRVIIKKGRRQTTAIIDIGESRKAVPHGSIGLFEEVLRVLNAEQGDVVEIDMEEKPNSVYFIRKKLDGKRLSKDEIDQIVRDIVNNGLSSIELTYFISACYTNKLTLEETVALTKAIVKHGGQLELKKKLVLDKHCTGGVPGNRTSMILVPIIAAAGFMMPKTSSRSITSPAGTADTMEVLAPVALNLEKIRRVVNKTNGCIVWGGAVELASADDRLIRLRHPMSLDPEGMLLASIIAKKAAVNSTHILIDIPVGKDTKIKTMKEATHLKREFLKVGKKMGMRIKAIITDGTEPIGNGIGPALEAIDVLKVLRRDDDRSLDLERKCLKMAAVLLQMAGVKDGLKKATEILESRKAYEKMKEIIRAQGGNPEIKPEDIAVGKYSYTYRAENTGTIMDIDNITISKIARIAGAPKDKGAGVYLYKHEHQCISKGDKVFTIYSDSKVKLKYALNILKRIGGIRVDHHGFCREKM